MGAMIIEILTAFFGMMILDIAFALYVIAAAANKAHIASLWAVLILLLNGVVILAYIDNNWMLVPAGAGAYVGTFIAIKLSGGKNEKIKDAGVEV